MMVDDVVTYLSTLSDALSLKRVQEELTLLRPALADLYQADRATFSLAAKLVKEKLGVNQRDLEAGLKPLSDRPHGSAPQATRLVELATDVDLFHSPDGEAWATVDVNNHREHWLLKARGFRRWLARRFYEEEGKAPGSQALQDALSVLEGKAVYEGTEYPVFTRIAEHEDNIYLDLANEKWEAIEISATDWRIAPSPPVRFRRTRGMLPLPRPIAGGSLDELRSFVNVQEEDWPLLIAWLFMAFSPRGPYPVLGLSGEQGSTKSTAARVLRAMIDPSSAPLRAAPREERDLMISAQAGWVMCFDNLSFFPAWLSDAFCRLATGGGFSTRELYTDSDEVIFDAQRPVLFTAIEDIVLSGDLVDRGIRLLLPALPGAKRKPESLFWQQFEIARPRILGAVLDVVSAALRRLPRVHINNLPRMADFALWVTAAEPAIGWERRTFLKAYALNRATANTVVLEASSVATALQLLVQKGEWEGTATELLEKLGMLVLEKETKAKGWPKNALALSNNLRRLAPSLGAASIEVIFSKTAGKDSKRLITIRTIEQSSDASDASDAEPVFTEEFCDAPNGGATHGATQSDAHPPASDAKNPNKNNGGDARDACDALLHTHSHDARAQNKRELF